MKILNFKGHERISFLPIRISKEIKGNSPSLKFIPTLLRCSHIAEKTKYPQMVIGRSLTIKQFKGCLILKHCSGDSINEIGGS